MTLVNGHSHDESSMPKKKLVQNAAGERDHDVVREAVEELCDELSFLEIWGSNQDPRVHLSHESGEIVHYLVEECCEEPEWIYKPLHKVPNEVWREYGVTPR